MAYFSSNSIVLVIGSHDKYQSLILVGLALTEKASSGIQYILFYYRSYWRGWRPLVTPWTGCIKEGIEPWKSQKWFFPSHVQVRFLLFSLLLLLFCSAFIVLIVIITMDIYLQRVYNSSGYEYKPRYFNKQNFSLLQCFLPLFAFLSLSLSSLMAIVWVHGYLTHTMSPAGSLHYMCSRLSNPYNINSLASHFCSLLSSLSLL